MRNYGEAIREHRLSRNLSLLDVEKATGIKNGSICRWENNQVIPGINFCEQLAEFYGISIDELIGLSDTVGERGTQKTAQPRISNSAVNFANEFEDIITDNNFVSISKLYKAINPQLRGLILGYIVGVLQSQGVNTQQILNY